MPAPLSALVLWMVLNTASASPMVSCPPSGFNRAALDALKASKFEIVDASVRQSLALALIPCLGDHDPALRDGIAFEAYYTWMRADKLDVATRGELLNQLSGLLDPNRADRAGFQQPFAALVLSEVVRTDRIAPWLTPIQRNALLDKAVRYLAAVRDYRDFDPKEGWRHGVAHGADLLLQLALNPAVDRAGLDRILDAVAAQVAPAGNHSYIDGEPERLARPVLFVAQRALLDAADWERWFARVVTLPPALSGDAAYRTRAGLAHQHNLQAFLYALYVNARESGDSHMQMLVPALQAAFKR
jgi:hypothetical protein